MLTRLDQIDGVECSFGNESGTLVRLSLRPGADPGKVAAVVRRILTEEVGDRIPVPLRGHTAAAALQHEQWRDRRKVIALATTGNRTLALLALLVACMAVAVALSWWRRRVRRNRPTAWRDFAPILNRSSGW